MSEPTEFQAANAPSGSADPSALRQDNERLRADLADTVDALAARADVTSRARQKAQDTKERAQSVAGSLSDRAKVTAGAVSDRAGTAKQRATAAGGQARQKAAQARVAAQDNPAPVAAGTAALAAGVLVAVGLRRRTARSGRLIRSGGR
ncbi:MAG: DUF3618 domain-containing protein [Pseudonocardia sp.]|jgi:hypothetical protein